MFINVNKTSLLQKILINEKVTTFNKKNTLMLSIYT